MSYEDIVKHIDEVTKTFPSVKVLVITGGECFLLGNDLDNIIAYSTKKGLSSRVVTNAYWAGTPDIAKKRLHDLVDAGLTEINFSTGDDHQKFVRFENIVNAVVAAHELGIKAICINIETRPNAKCTLESVESDEILSPLIKEGAVICIAGAWMNFKKSEETEQRPFYIPIPKKRRCQNLYNSIVINPYHELLACCGLTVEYNKYLKVGNLQSYSIKDLYDYQFNDLFKFWLYVDGPEYIYEMLMKERGLPKKRMIHECEYCMELVRDENNVKIVGKLVKKELNNILYRNTLRKNNLKSINHETS
jgi:hypothetical protein